MSANFNVENLEKKLVGLNDSQQSIQTLSLWLIHHRKHHKTVVATWLKMLRNAKEPAKKLSLMYLANDVIQNSRKKGPEYPKEFSGILVQAFELIARDCDDKTYLRLEKILKVWDERSVFDKEMMYKLKSAIGNRTITGDKKLIAGEKRSGDSSSSLAVQKMDSKRSKIETTKATSISSGSRKSSTLSNLESLSSSSILSSSSTYVAELPVAHEGTIINPEILVRALKDIEMSASKDVKIKNQIACFPNEITDPSFVRKIRDKKSADKLSKQIDEALIILNKYNYQLSQEMEHRKAIGIMLATYIMNQKDLLSKTEKQLSEFRDKVKKVHQVKNELINHLSKLPDLRNLPNVMEPLPSVDDLFGLHSNNVKNHFNSSTGSLASSSSPSSSTSPATPTTPNS